MLKDLGERIDMALQRHNEGYMGFVAGFLTCIVVMTVIAAL